MTSHWADYHARWSKIGPPLRPDADVVAGVRDALRDHPGPTLLLGVTPELADAAEDVTAVDRSEGMIRGVWPGDTPSRRAIRADWFELPFAAQRFVAAVGDGSLNAVTHPDGHGRLYGELARVLRPGARAVLRVFCRPTPGESIDALLADATRGAVANFHAFKWRLAMSLAETRGTPNLAVRELRAAFFEAVPDRAQFALRAGWDASDVDTIDVYRDSSEVYSFPTRAELLAGVPPWFAPQLSDVGGYPLAERCPLLVLDHRAERGAPA